MGGNLRKVQVPPLFEKIHLFDIQWWQAERDYVEVLRRLLQRGISGDSFQPAQIKMRILFLLQAKVILHPERPAG